MFADHKFDIGEEGFDPTDTVVSQLPLLSTESSTFTPLTETSEISDDIEFYLYKTTFFMRPSCGTHNGSVLEIWLGASDLRGFVSAINRTLSPAGWKWGMDISGYPYKGNGTRLALKTILDTESDLNLDKNPPESQRYDSETKVQSVDINPPKGLYSAEDSTDVGYFLWEMEPSIYSCLQIGCSPKDVTILNTNLLPPEKDFLTGLPNENITDSIDFGRIETENRSAIYFSFPVENPCLISWDPVLAINEVDPAQPADSFSLSLHRSSWMLIILLLFISFGVTK